MTIYIILYLAILLFALIPNINHNSKLSRQVFLFLSLSAMALIVGLRGTTVGEDTSMYLGLYEKAAAVQWSDIFHNFFSRTVFEIYSYGYQDTVESSFLALCKICNIILKDGHLFLLFISALTYILFGKFIYDNTDHVVFATLVLLCESVFMSSFNGIRQLLSIAIALQSYKYIRQKDYIHTIAWVIPAYLIHNSSIIALLLIPIELIKDKHETKWFKYITISSVFLPFAIITLSNTIIRFFPRYRLYFIINYWENSVGGAVILLAIEALLIVYLYYKKFPVSDSFKLSCFVLIYISLEITGYQITMFSRLASLFRSFLILFFPCAIQVFKGKNRWAIRGIILIALFFMYYSFASSPSRLYSLYF